MEPGDDLVERVLRDALGGRNGNASVSQVTVNTSWGVWVSVVLCVVSGMLSAFSLYVANDTRNEIRHQETMLQSKIQALENTDNAIRAYINTGKMPPAPSKK